MINEYLWLVRYVTEFLLLIFIQVLVFWIECKVIFIHWISILKSDFFCRYQHDMILQKPCLPLLRITYEIHSTEATEIITLTYIIWLLITLNVWYMVVLHSELFMQFISHKPKLYFSKKIIKGSVFSFHPLY